MTVKDDEILVVQTILCHCFKEYDPIPTEDLMKLNIPPKRLLYLLNKMDHFIEYGVNVMYGWLCADPAYIRNYYNHTHRVIFT